MTTETTLSQPEAGALVRELGTHRRHDDRHGRDDRLGDLHHLGRIGAAGGHPGWLLAAWAVSGLMTILAAVSAAEIAAMMPRAGGQYVFLREAYSPMFGFLFGWAMFLVVQTGTIAAVAVAFAKFLGVFLPGVAADSLPRRADPAGRLRGQPLDAAARRRRPDRLLTAVNMGA